MAEFIRALAGDSKSIRVVCCSAGEMINTVTIKLDYPLTVSDIYGRTLMGTYLMRQLMKEGEMSVFIDADGPIKSMDFKCTEDVLKGAVLKSDDKDTLAFTMPNQLLGQNGSFRTVINSGFGQPFTGQSPLVSGDISGDIAYYYQLSEQKPSVVVLGIKSDGREITAAGGLIIQLLPDATEDDIIALENRLDVMSTFSDKLDQGLSLEQTLKSVFGDILSLDIIEQPDFDYTCDCSKDKVEKALISAGKDELIDMMTTQQGAELHCNFCNTYYRFNQDDLQRIITSL